MSKISQKSADVVYGRPLFFSRTEMSQFASKPKAKSANRSPKKGVINARNCYPCCCKKETFSIKGQDPNSTTTQYNKKLFANSLLFFVGCKDLADFYGDLKLSKLHANLNYRLDVCTTRRHGAVHLGYTVWMVKSVKI